MCKMPEPPCFYQIKEVAMPVIHLLDSQIINQIAAGEVVERPSAVVKELVENSIDAGADTITVEITDGGTSLIRITDNGCGVGKEDICNAFLRHSTSKISSIEDLHALNSLGFRGEALASIASVAKVEMITKPRESLCGIRYRVEGGREFPMEEIGCPDGTTFLVRNLFFNTPARKKFLKSNMTEGNYISELMERLALSNPSISFQYISQNQKKFQTSGNGKETDVIYQIFGRDIARNLLEVCVPGMAGFIGNPVIARGNRGMMNYFINGRYVKNRVVSRAIEAAYKPYMMQRKYPFTAFFLTIDKKSLDVNVHPAKMEVRFDDEEAVYQLVYHAISDRLREKELIPEVSFSSEKEVRKELKEQERKEETLKTGIRAPEPFEKGRILSGEQLKQIGTLADVPDLVPEGMYLPESTRLPEKKMPSENTGKEEEKPGLLREEAAEAVPGNMPRGMPQQMNLFDEKLLSRKSVKEHRLIGQIFDTYWIVQFQDKMYLIDQHAAHEKVLYERNLAAFEEKRMSSQQLFPPEIISLQPKEEELLLELLPTLHSLGYEIEPFGGKEYAIRAVPADLYGLPQDDLLVMLLGELMEDSHTKTPQMLLSKLASMSCKAAIKGGDSISFEEAHALIDELLALENPYNCPHGRPTIISMSRYELEKKFKRVL